MQFVCRLTSSRGLGVDQKGIHSTRGFSPSYWASKSGMMMITLMAFGSFTRSRHNKFGLQCMVVKSDRLLRSVFFFISLTPSLDLLAQTLQSYLEIFFRGPLPLFTTFAISIMVHCHRVTATFYTVLHNIYETYGCVIHIILHLKFSESRTIVLIFFF